MVHLVWYGVNIDCWETFFYYKVNTPLFEYLFSAWQHPLKDEREVMVADQTWWTMTSFLALRRQRHESLIPDQPGPHTLPLAKALWRAGYKLYRNAAFTATLRSRYSGPTRLQLLKVPKSLQTEAPTGDKVFKPMSLWRTFLMHPTTLTDLGKITTIRQVFVSYTAYISCSFLLLEIWKGKP